MSVVIIATAFPNISGTGLAAKEQEIKLLEEAGVTTIAGSSFGAQGEGYLRLSYANFIDNIRATTGRIRDWLAKQRSA